MGQKKLSINDKVEKALEFFKETKVPWSMKELEVVLPKKKGIVSQSIVAVLQELLCENLVHKEKLGLSILYWAFPSDFEQQKRNKIKKHTEELKELEDEVSRLGDLLLSEEGERTDTPARRQALEEYQELFVEDQKNHEELSLLGTLDPVLFQERKIQMEHQRKRGNQWTDHFFILLSFCRKNFNIDSKQLFQITELPPELDYL